MSNKTTRFMVEIVSSEEIADNFKDEMAQNIANAIVEGVFSTDKFSTDKICPPESGAYTEVVYVKEWYSDKQIIEHI